ncbi:MAG: hypothetical protein ACPGVO_10255 [Spirulinaceae cyanobacterium]
MEVYRHACEVFAGAAIALVMAQPAATNTTATFNAHEPADSLAATEATGSTISQLHVSPDDGCLETDSKSQPFSTRGTKSPILSPVPSVSIVYFDPDQCITLDIHDQPVGEVLKMLASAANVNVLFHSDLESERIESTISLQLEDESLQDTFSIILELSGFKAVRRSRTILVTDRSFALPPRRLITQKVRLRQANVDVVANFLQAQGAHTIFVDVDSDTIHRSEMDCENCDLTLERVSVVINTRLNAITIIGEPHKVQLALETIETLEAQPQTINVNVKILSVDRQRLGRLGSSSSDLPDTHHSPSNIINFGDQDYSLPDGVSTAGDFVSLIQAALENNSAEILLDRDLVVPQGRFKATKLVEEIVTNVEVEREVADGVTTVNTRLKSEDIGLILSLKMGYSDDSGLIPMEVNPTVLSIGDYPTDSRNVPISFPIPVERQQLSSGMLQVYSNQTVVLTGIIPIGEAFPAPAQILSPLTVHSQPPLIGTLQGNARPNPNREIVILITPTLQMEPSAMD